MNVDRRLIEDVESLEVRQWRSSGVPNGFLGAGVDSRGDTPRCDKIVQELCGSGLPVFRLKQVHSARICDLTAGSGVREADGWFFSFQAHKGIFGIETADCAPVLLCTRDKSFGAALHCGWRGAAAGLLPHALELFDTHGVSRADLEICIGPCAGGCCYEVGDDV